MSKQALLGALTGEAWAMEPGALRRFIDAIDALPDEHEAFYRDDGDAGQPQPLDVRDGVAHIPIAGTLMKRVPGWARYFGINATSTQDTQAKLKAALADRDVRSIVLDVESPGGMVKGIEELADDVRAAREIKPVHTHASDMMASAAYWVGSQADSVSANAMASVGSIGVYTVIDDTSEAAAKRGIKTHVIASAPLKGAGVAGAPFTAEMVADEQRLVDEYAARFVSAVAAGRRASEDDARSWATGQVWLADEAQRKGLIDTVSTAEAAHDAAAIGSTNNPAPLGAKEKPMADETKGAAVKADDKEELRARIAELEKDKLEALAHLENARRDMCAQEIKRGVSEGRITPTLKAQVEKYAEACDFDAKAVAEFVGGLPVQVRRERESVAVPEPVVEKPKDDSMEAACEKHLGIKRGLIGKMTNIVAITDRDGERCYELANGDLVPCEEVLS